MNFLALLKEEKERARRELLASKSKVGENHTTCEQKNEIVVENAVQIEETNQPIIRRELSHYKFAVLEGPLLKYRLECGYSAIYYIPSVIDERYANFLLGEIEAANDRWTILRSRRLQLWGKLPSSHQLPSPQYDQTIPDWLENLINQEISAGIFSEDMRPTNILINQYEADQGIMHHTDGPSYENKVSIISLESPLIMTFKPKLSTDEIGIKSDADVISIVLQPRSLLVFSEELYDVFLHGISADPIHTVGETAPCVNLGICGLNNGDKIQRSRRTSITLRKVKE